MNFDIHHCDATNHKGNDTTKYLCIIFKEKCSKIYQLHNLILIIIKR
jgi:hypothetical protein